MPALNDEDLQRIREEYRLLGFVSGRVENWPFQVTDKDGYPTTLEAVIESLTDEQREVECVLIDYSEGVRKVIDHKVVTLTSEGPFIYKEQK